MTKAFQTLIFEALGAASMCWSETPTGVFDSEKATKIGNKLMADLLPINTVAVPPSGMGDVSDGYHTFNDLYAHRMALTLALVKSWPNRSWRSKQHNPGDTPIFDGFFIVGMDLPGVGQITYHYKLEHWNAFDGVRELEHAPKWDGHRPEDVVERLNKWSENI